MKLKEKFGYMKMNKINPSMISIDGAIDIVATPRLCGSKSRNLDASKPFNLTKACLIGLWEFATWGNLTPKKDTNEDLSMKIIS
jgi:hypothetical protein